MNSQIFIKNNLWKLDTQILQIDRLSVSFETHLGCVKAAKDVSFNIFEWETLALVGETGCGKSVVASAILQLLPNNAAIRGSAIFNGRDLLHISEMEISRIRGSEIAIVFQNPSLALNPTLQVREQIAEPLEIHKRTPRHQSLQMAESILSHLGLCEHNIGRMYPFQFSGGMNQRVMIATSVILSPKLIIADEPTKGLDAEAARDVMRELTKIKDQIGASLLLITHDLSLARSISDKIAVMYCGEILEMGNSKEVFQDPLHPYTRALLECLPEKGFKPIPGNSPSMIHPPQGCKFHPRCPHKCEKFCQQPDMIEIKGTDECISRQVKCWLY